MSATYLLLRGSTWYYRRRVPSDCRKALSRREIIESLRTDDRTEARKLGALRHALYDAVISQIRYARMADFDPFKGVRIGRFHERRITKADGTVETISEVTPESIRALADAGFTPEQIADLIRDFNARNAGQPAAHPPATAVRSDQHLRLSQLITKYDQNRIDEHRGNWEPDKGDAIKFRRLLELLDDIPIALVDRDAARRVRQKIILLPRNTAAYRGMPIQKVLHEVKQEAKNGVDYTTISATQVNNHLTLYSSLFTFAIREGFIKGANPFEGLQVNDDKAEKDNARRFKFSDDELKAIFSEPIFVDFKAAHQKNRKIKPYRYWTPLLALYTGARPCEIGALRTTDIVKVEGVWVIDFNNKTSDKCSKSHNAIRKTPIHSHLLDLGFLEFVKQARRAGQERLFDELKYDEREGYGRYLNERFVETILKPLDIYIPSKKVFYSFRHTLTTALFRAKVDQLHREQICGREAEDKSIGDLFYVADEELSTLKAELERISFRDLLSNVNAWS